MRLARRYWIAGLFASLAAHGAGAALLMDGGSEVRMERAAGSTSIVVGSMHSALAAQAETEIVEPLETTGTTAEAVTPAEAEPVPDAKPVTAEPVEDASETETPQPANVPRVEAAETKTPQPAETPQVEKAEPKPAQETMTLAAIDPEQVEAVEAVEPPPIPSPRPPRASDNKPKPARTGRAIEGRQQKARSLNNSNAGAETPRETARRTTRLGEGGRGEVRGGNASLSNYQGLILSRLQRAKRYPGDARRRGIQGIAVLSFTVTSSGQVSGARIARSSGHAVLDQAVMALIRRAGPFPPIPREIGRNRIGIRVPIQFAVR